MSTAHRPTWAPAMGGEEQGGARFYVASRMMSAKNMPGQMTMKFRQVGQSAPSELRGRDLEDMRADLEERERKAANKGIDFEEERKKDLAFLEAAPTAGDGGKALALKPLVPKAADADESDGDDASSSEDSDDEDEEAALMAELDRIKKERAEEARKKANEQAAEDAKEKEKELMTGNPLLGLGQDVSFSMKRRWDEDVVFKNQARSEPKAVKRFINDTIRSDFHKRFLTRYIR
mmetsp:Transcript_17550/g.30113  ORF Transcript_17550/g.30113 Transcript_17550/m.30113 type:complete len:234 (+) Transcript_17550:75-776(+)|eukprot:CAMPEP_0119107402 /NCGR_PEP_ID=MMETSP1180-20130426/9823_1 /TAXON_ID=3052 ORGANISM="Chlamydomonas cf sp, Strain CCMP681" /NCGR_SAMPLE_ID=MMETSP1180 /ASSEMBLY_ACC=CAM_ASM_000741 /LENGTH=233 /DNA_ID=CAMNT_0007092881 /DNA_START=57 /DNA_END=758 /DNA_ORIENTATION=+